jgi:hypothetical protein
MQQGISLSGASSGGRSRDDRIKVPKTKDHSDFPEPSRRTLTKGTLAGIDVAKNVMQMHYVDEETAKA